jgi:hypothetical protein
MAKINVRHECSSCRRKIYEFKMYRYYYPLLNRTAWHCAKCVKSQSWDTVTIMKSPALGEK